jgi:hypothetical protein
MLAVGGSEASEAILILYNIDTETGQLRENPKEIDFSETFS